LDCARDFTEYWVHQEQIREATDRRESDFPDAVHAVLDTFLRAMPYTLEGCPRVEGTSVAVQVDRPGGGRWSWRHDGDVWRPAEREPGRETVVRFDDADTLWRLGTRMLSPTLVGVPAGQQAASAGPDVVGGPAGAEVRAAGAELTDQLDQHPFCRPGRVTQTGA
jgi:hypothetical protein